MLTARALVCGVVGLWCVGCLFDPTVTSAGGTRPEILCATDNDCPPDWLCMATLQRCVPREQRDSQAPALADPPRLTPPVGSVGQSLKLTLEVTEALAQDPTVEMDIGDGRSGAWTLDDNATDRAARRYGYRYRVTGNEREGTRVNTVAFVDVAGNSVDDLSVGTVVLDFSPPRVTQAQLTRHDAAAHVEVELHVEFTEPLPVPPEVVLHRDGSESHRMLYVDDNSSLSHRYAFMPTGEEAEGTYAVTVSGADAAGNRFSEVQLGKLTLDFTPPVVSARTDTARARGGQSVLVEVDLGEELALWGALTAVSTTDGAVTHTYEEVGRTSRRLLFENTVGSDMDGTYRLELVDLTDLAGNTTPVAHLGTVSYDTTPPALSDFVQSHQTALASDTLVVTFATNEDLAADPVVTLGGLPMQRRGTGAAPFEYALPLATTGLVGIVDIQVRMQDLVRNDALVTPGQVELDAVPPKLLSVVFTPSVARQDVEAVLAVTASELLSATPILTWLAPRGDPGFHYLGSSGLSHLWTLDVTDNIAVGDYAVVKLTLRDQAGNVSEWSTGDPPTVFAVDAQRPLATSLTLNATTLSAQPAHNALVVDFDLSEPVDGGLLEVSLGDIDLDCDPPVPGTLSGLLHVTCHHVVRGSEPEGLNIVSVRAVDEAGNESVTSTPMRLDFTSPGIAAAFVNHLPGPGNPLSLVTRATVGTEVVLVVTADERVDAGASATLRLRCGEDELASALEATALTDGTAVFHIDVPALSFDGVCQPMVTWADPVGNRGAVTFDEPAIEVKTSTPTLQVDQTAVRFMRAPWGRAPSPDLGVESLPAGPYFALVPSVAQAALRDLPAHTFSLVDESLALLQVWADAERRSLLGTTPANPDGTWPRLQLANLDTPWVYVSGVDEAGNVSSPIPVENAEWVATFGGKRAGLVSSNPHRAIAQPSFTGSLRGVEQLYPGATELDGAKLAAIDGDAVRVDPAAEWLDLNGMHMPKPREYFSLAYDSWRGVSVLHGGTDINATGPACCSNAELGDTWLWDGARWVEHSVPNPQPRVTGAASVFDPVRGVTVQFGGCTNTGTATNGVWEFDGIDWRLIAPTDPEADGNPDPACYGVAMAFDHASSRVVMQMQKLLGVGNNPRDLWFWDGTSWEGFDPDAAMDGDSEPSSFWRFGPIYDPVTHRLLNVSRVGGGQPVATYAWTGRSWQLLAVPDPEQDGVPTNLLALAMSTSRREIIAIEKFTPSTIVTWRYDGTSWRRLETVGGPDPSIEFDPGFVFDASRDVYVLVVGYDDQETWEFDGATWRRRMTTNNPVAPTEPFDFSPSSFVGYDPGRQQIVREAAGMEAWIDRAWYPVADLPNSPSQGSPLWPWLVQQGTGRILEVGDEALHLLSDTSWSTTTTFAPTYWSWAQCAFEGDATSDVRVVDYDGGGVWALRSGVWTQITTSVPGTETPNIEWDVAWDPVAQELIATDVSTLDQFRTWTWSASGGWSRVATTDSEGDGEPGPLREVSLFFDAGRGAVVLFGGYVDTQGFLEYTDDLWQWNGGSWQRLPTVDVHLDGGPRGRGTATVVHHPELGGQFLHGGLSYDDRAIGYESWFLVDATQARAAVVLDFDPRAAELGDAVLVGSSLRVVAGATTRNTSTERTAPDVRLWRQGDWVSGAGTRTPSGSFVQWVETVPAHLLRAERLRAVVLPASMTPDDDEHVHVDYAELTVRYQRR